MYGAIIGDLAGSIYEYGQIKKVSTVSVDKIILENSFFSDDTILTVAILDAILHHLDYKTCLQKYINEYMNYQPRIKPYFKTAFSPQLIKWSKGLVEGISKGNGAMMRISSIGYLFDTVEDIKQQSYLATIPSHNSSEAIEASKLVALIIYYGRVGLSKEEIIKKLSLTIDYTPFSSFNTTCSETLPNCLYALFSQNSFNEAIRKVISYGGDTDTNACIVGSMAEALYGIDDELISLAKQKIPSEFNEILEKGYSKVKKYRVTSN